MDVLGKTFVGADFGFLPVGAIVPAFSVKPPPGFVLPYGQNLSRATYPKLFEALTLLITGTIANGSPTVTSVSEDITALGILGSRVEATNVTAGTTLTAATSTTLTLSANAGASGSRSIRLLPYGAPDTSNFTLPDLRDRVIAARGNMGGTAAGRLSNTGTGHPGIDGNRMGSAGGADRHILTVAQMPSHAHDVIGSLAGAGGGSNRDMQGGSNNVTSSSAGGGEQHPNAQPTIVGNVFMFAGL